MLDSTLCERISKVTQLQRRWSGWEETALTRPLYRSAKPTTLKNRPSSAGTLPRDRTCVSSSHLSSTPVSRQEGEVPASTDILYSSFGLSRVEVSQLHALSEAVHRIVLPSNSNFHSSVAAPVCILESLAIILADHCILGPLLRTLCGLNFSKLFIDPLPFLTSSERVAAQSICDSSVSWIDWIHKRAAKWNQCMPTTAGVRSVDIQTPQKRRSTVKKQPSLAESFHSIQSRLNTGQLRLHFRAWRAQITARSSREDFSRICLRSCALSTGPLLDAFQRWKSVTAMSLTSRFRGHFDRLQFVQQQDGNRLAELSQSLHDYKRRLMLAEAEIINLRDALALSKNALKDYTMSASVIDFRRPVYAMEVNDGELQRAVDPISDGVIYFTTKRKDLPGAIPPTDHRWMDLHSTAFFDVGKEQQVEGVATPNSEQYASYYTVRVESGGSSSTACEGVGWANAIIDQFCRENLTFFVATAEARVTTTPFQRLSLRIFDRVSHLTDTFQKTDHEIKLLRTSSKVVNNSVVTCNAVKTFFELTSAAELIYDTEMFALFLISLFPNAVREKNSLIARSNRALKITDVEWRQMIPWFNCTAESRKHSWDSLHALLAGSGAPELKDSDFFTGLEPQALRLVAALRSRHLNEIFA
jgi:hypothetical protein